MATKKITKKTIVNKVEEVSNETPSVTKKAVTKKIDRSILSNITSQPLFHKKTKCKSA